MYRNYSVHTWPLCILNKTRATTMLTEVFQPYTVKNEVWISYHWCNIWHCEGGNHSKFGVIKTSQCHILYHIFYSVQDYIKICVLAKAFTIMSLKNWFVAATCVYRYIVTSYVYVWVQDSWCVSVIATCTDVATQCISIRASALI